MIRFDELQGRASLAREVQRSPPWAPVDAGGSLPNGIVGPGLRAALSEFARLRNLAGGLNGLIDEPYARALLSVEPVAFVLEQARNRSAIYADYLRQEQGFDAEHLAFLDRGARGSPMACQLEPIPRSPQASPRPD